MPGNSTIFRTNNPLDWRQVDGVYIDERTPPGAIRGIGNDRVCVVGEFERGPVDTITSVSSTKEFAAIFGGYGPNATGIPYPGYLAFVAKRFSRVDVIRVSNGTQAVANATITDGAGSPVNVLRIEALNAGRWGNRLSYLIADGNDGITNHFTLTVYLDGASVEIFKNLDLASVADTVAFPLGSTYVLLTRLALGDGKPATVGTATALTGGSDGTFADADYTGSTSNAKGLQLLYGSEADAIRWVMVAERVTANINAALLLLAQTTKTKIVVIAGPSGQTKAAALVDVALYRSDRVVYVYPWVDAYVPEADGGTGGLMRVSPNSFAAAACSALPPGTDPAGVNSEPFLSGIRNIGDRTLGRNDYVALKAAGIMALQFTAERQTYGFRSGVNTHLDEALRRIARRTMTDYLQESIAARLAFFQNKPLILENKLAIKSEIEDFLDTLIKNRLLPNKADLDFRLSGGVQLLPYLVDIYSGNSASDEALGIFVVFLRVRTFAAMEAIVLRTEIGQSVEITELAA